MERLYSFREASPLCGYRPRTLRQMAHDKRIKFIKTVGCRIECINIAEDNKSDLMSDLISILTSFTARYYGLRRARRKTEKIIAELKEGGKK